MKRRLITLIICLAVMLGCIMPVFAESSATYVENITTITSDGNCQVTIRVNIHIDERVDNLTFPLPLGAKDVMMNGSSARATKRDGALHVDVSDMLGGYTGDVSLKFDFRLEKVVRFEDGKYLLELPLLSGFEYPVERMEFTITLPDDIKGRPYFTGGYRQSTVESIMTIAVKGDMITGSTNQTLDDRETLTMTMEVDEKMFPGVSTYQRTGNPEIIPMIILAVLGLVYWCVFLRTGPLLWVRKNSAPEGVSAGELGCRLTFVGADLTMMVFHWAQLGYIMIQQDNRGRVVLHKRMDMGNERSLFEVKTFKALFGRHRAIDGTGYHYASLARKLDRQIPGERTMCKPTSGNAKIFRILFCAVQLFCGICLGMNMTGNEILQILLAVILAIFGGISAWIIQGGMYRIHLRDKTKVYLALILSLVWLILGLIAGVILITLIPLLGQLLCGIMAAYGGRRSELGKINATEILGLRHHLRKVDSEELYRLRKRDPEYFYNMIPHALALGVEKKFAINYGKKKLQPCPYLVTARPARQNAFSWAMTMKEVAKTLDARKNKMKWEQFAIVRVK